MADPHCISTLRRQQAELQDIISSLEGKLAEAQPDLGHVNAVLRFYEIDSTVLQFAAHVNVSGLFKREAGERRERAVVSSGGVVIRVAGCDIVAKTRGSQMRVTVC